MTRRHNERGSISIWVVTATIVMMTLVGLAVDLGGQVHAQQRAHDVAAQAARAGGQQVEAAPAVEGRYIALDAAAARRAAEQYLAAAGAGYGREDDSAVVKVYERLCGFEVGGEVAGKGGGEEGKG